MLEPTWCTNLKLSIAGDERPMFRRNVVCPQVTEVLIAVPATQQVDGPSQRVYAHLVTSAHTGLRLLAGQGAPHGSVLLLWDVRVQGPVWNGVQQKLRNILMLCQERSITLRLQFGERDTQLLNFIRRTGESYRTHKTTIYKYLIFQFLLWVSFKVTEMLV